MLELIPFSKFCRYYPDFARLLLFLLALDLGVFNRQTHAVRHSEIAARSVGWPGCCLRFKVLRLHGWVHAADGI